MLSHEEQTKHFQHGFVAALEPLTPILFGASSFQYLNAACELGLFDLLYKEKSMSKEDIAKELQLENRAINILLLGTTSLNLTHKIDDKYENSSLIESLFESNGWDIFKDVVAFEQYITYKPQFELTESLRNNKNIGLKHVPGTTRDLYHRLSENPSLEKYFYKYMNSWTELSNPLLFNAINFDDIKKLIDAGGGTAINAIDIAKRSPNTNLTVVEIESAAHVAEQNIKDNNLSSRISVHKSNMFETGFPEGHDAILFSHQLCIWTEVEVLELLNKAYEALPVGGRVIIFGSMSNDNGDGPLMSALDSVYFATTPAEGGMIYAWADYESWLNKAGFKKIKRHKDDNFWTPHGVIEAIK